MILNIFRHYPVLVVCLSFWHQCRQIFWHLLFNVRIFPGFYPITMNASFLMRVASVWQKPWTLIVYRPTELAELNDSNLDSPFIHPFSFLHLHVFISSSFCFFPLFHSLSISLFLFLSHTHIHLGFPLLIQSLGQTNKQRVARISIYNSRQSNYRDDVCQTHEVNLPALSRGGKKESGICWKLDHHLLDSKRTEYHGTEVKDQNCFYGIAALFW